MSTRHIVPEGSNSFIKKNIEEEEEDILLSTS